MSMMAAWVGVMVLYASRVWLVTLRFKLERERGREVVGLLRKKV